MCFNTIKIIRSVLLLALLFLPACGGGDGGPLPPTTFPIGGGGGTTIDASIRVSWVGNPEAAVNRSLGGYKVYYSTTSGFNPGDVGVTEIDVPFVSGLSAPTSVVIPPPLSPGVYFIRVAAYSALNAPGTIGGSISTVAPQITLTVP